MQISETFLVRFMVFSLVLAVLAGQWDIWWHVAIGRETFWEPPHILLYGGVLLAIIAGVYGWIRFKHVAWKRIGIVLALVPFLGPIDELWHRIFGSEDLTSALIIWSPPHMLLITMIFVALMLALPLARVDPDVGLRRLLGLFVYGAMLQLFLIAMIPFDPVGPYHVLGISGVLPIAFVLAFMFLFVRNELVEGGSTMLFSAVAIVFYFVGAMDREAPQVVVGVHEHIPPWVVAFSYLVPALLLDCFVKPRATIIAGLVVGASWVVITYGISSLFFVELSPYGWEEMLLLFALGLLGGAAGGAFARIAGRDIHTFSVSSHAL